MSKLSSYRRVDGVAIVRYGWLEEGLTTRIRLSAGVGADGCGFYILLSRITSNFVNKICDGGG